MLFAKIPAMLWISIDWLICQIFSWTGHLSGRMAWVSGGGPAMRRAGDGEFSCSFFSGWLTRRFARPGTTGGLCCGRRWRLGNDAMGWQSDCKVSAGAASRRAQIVCQCLESGQLPGVGLTGSCVARWPDHVCACRVGLITCARAELGCPDRRQRTRPSVIKAPPRTASREPSRWPRPHCPAGTPPHQRSGLPADQQGHGLTTEQRFRRA